MRTVTITFRPGIVRTVHHAVAVVRLNEGLGREEKTQKSAATVWRHRLAFIRCRHATDRTARPILVGQFRLQWGVMTMQALYMTPQARLILLVVENHARWVFVRTKIKQHVRLLPT